MEHPRYRWTTAMLDVPFLMGATGARSLPGPALVLLLGGLGRGDSAARNLLTRMVEFGALEASKHGRSNVFRLAASSAERYDEVEGTAAEPVWEGSFQSILYSVPEASRTLRDRVLHTATAAGFGLLRPGVLLAVGDRAARLNLTPSDMSEDSWLEIGTLTPSSTAQARRLAWRAWRLPELAASYTEATSLCRQTIADVPQGWAGLVAWRDIYSLCLAAQLADPHLPAELLPERWPLAEFVTAQADMNRVLGGAVQPFLREQLARECPEALEGLEPNAWDERDGMEPAAD